MPPITQIPAWHTELLRADTSRGWVGGVWTSEVMQARFSGADEAVASWNLSAHTSAVIDIRAGLDGGTWSPWLRVANWAAPGQRTSGPVDAVADQVSMRTDVLTAAPGQSFDAVQLRIELGAHASPADLRAAAVNVTAPADPHPVPAALVTASVPIRPLSQRAHPALPRLGGGGPAWCSPTSLTMVAEYWGIPLPAVCEEAAPGADPRIPLVAALVYDRAYDGTGNWSFNVAAAAEWGLDAVVTRLSSLSEAETLLAAGIPVIASVAFGPGEMPGADYDTGGHLLVVRGFSPAGEVLVADPANDGGAQGLRSYPRIAFDVAWARSRRAVYLLTAPSHPLPPRSASCSW